MTEETLADRLVTFIRERGSGVSFVELERQFPDEFRGDGSMSAHGYRNIVLWEPISPDMVEAINVSIGAGLIEMHPTQPMVYFIDGKVFNAPIARKARDYKYPRWLPVAFNALGTT